MNILTRIINLFRRRSYTPQYWVQDEIQIIHGQIEYQQTLLAKAKRLKLRRVHIYARLEALRSEQLRLEALRNG